MKKHLSTIVTVIALVVAIIAQFRISDLQDKIRQLENNLNNNARNLDKKQPSFKYSLFVWMFNFIVICLFFFISRFFAKITKNYNLLPSFSTIILFQV